MLNYYRRLKGREHSFYAYRDYTIIITLLGSGMRLGELCNLKWKDVDLITGGLDVAKGESEAQAFLDKDQSFGKRVKHTGEDLDSFVLFLKEIERKTGVRPAVIL